MEKPGRVTNFCYFCLLFSTENAEDFGDLRKLVSEQLEGITNGTNLGGILGHLSRIGNEYLINVYVDGGLAYPSRHTVFVRSEE